MSDLKFEGIKSSAVFESLGQGLQKMTEAEKKAQIKKVNGIIQFNIKGAGGKTGQWTIDLKKEGTVYKGPAKPKADAIVNASDETFQKLADGKLTGQKAFMSGALSVKGNMMLATKLDVVLKGAQAKL